MAAVDRANELELTPEQVERRLREQPELQVIDVREEYERDAGHIAGTRHIALVELASRAQSLEREQPVVFYCRVGSRSLMAAQAFRASGFEAYTMTGGLLRWAREGRPLEPAHGHVADH